MNRLVVAVALTLLTACSSKTNSDAKASPKPANVAISLTARAVPAATVMMAPGAPTYSASATEVITIEAGYLVISRLAFTEMIGCDKERDPQCAGDADDGMNDSEDDSSHTMSAARFRAQSGGHSHDDTPNDVTTTTETQSTEDMMRLEEAGPFVIELNGQPARLGAFAVPSGSYGRFVMMVAPSVDLNEPVEAVGLSLYLKGQYTSPVTTFGITARISGQREISLMPMSMGGMGMASQSMDDAEMTIALEKNTAADIRFDPTNWFTGLNLADAATAATITDNSALAGLLLDKIAGSARLGIDANGDGKIEAAEYQAIAMEGCMMMSCEGEMME